MSILVAGGAGYIGSFVARAFIRAGFDVVIYDNLSTGHQESLPKIAKFVKGDVLDHQLMVHTLKTHGIVLIVHLCAFSLVSESVSNPIKYFDNNICGAVQLLKAMETVGVKKLVFSSTAAVYGVRSEKITEDIAPAPINPYGVSKHVIEQMLRCVDCDSVALRYFNAGGAGDGVGELHDPETHLVPCVCERFLQGQKCDVFGSDYATKDGTCVRDYIHVRDLADAHVLAAQRILGRNCQRGLEVYNLGSAEGYSVLEVVSEIQKCIPGNFQIQNRRDGDPDFLVAENAKARSVLGWSPKYDLKDIVMDACKWHKNGRKFAVE
ncbi:UDP-glucose 4-epimerase [Spironucleus salmonicida]|uniref:UDP-glucose 4-epimerase n=1 Tax=Spironucleus salmonicida TaxID=348837 RepID=V6LM42_9EUKA|nr:UDP-glucose 4-epimerase [Spironucleus salmonicida]|eukprot:EST44776.1 UDP-glucose 4-epimerase [Spironucleus salmonicida]